MPAPRAVGWDGSEVVPPGSSLVEIDLMEQPPDGTLAFPCLGPQNPYKARHPWVWAKLMWQGQSARRPVFPPSELAFPSPFRRA